MIKITLILLTVLGPLAAGHWCWLQAKKARKDQWNVPNSYELGLMYKKINRYETASGLFYVISLIGALTIFAITF